MLHCQSCQMTLNSEDRNRAIAKGITKAFCGVCENNQPKDKVKGAATGGFCTACGSVLKWVENSRTHSLFPGCSKWPVCKGPKHQAKTQLPKIDSGSNFQMPQRETGETPSSGKALMDMLYKDIRAKLEKDVEVFGSTVNEQFEYLQDRIDATLDEMKKQVMPKSIEWKVNDHVIAKLDGKHHKALNDLMRRVKASMKNMLVVGPAGSGKTTLADNLATSLKLEFAHISCSGGMPEWHLSGRSMPDLTTGNSKYQISDFVRLYENGGVFLLDEVDSADPNVLIFINSALANGYLSLASRVENPIAKRHKDFYLVAAANTYGRGADLQYVGRNALDAAFLDRFVGAVITIDYDRDLEVSLVPEEDILLRIWDMREKAEKFKIRRVVGTRAALAAASLFRSGETIKDSIMALTVGWTADEISKCVSPFEVKATDLKLNNLNAQKQAKTNSLCKTCGLYTCSNHAACAAAGARMRRGY